MLISLWLNLPNIKWLDKIIIFRYVTKHYPKLYEEIEDYIP